MTEPKTFDELIAELEVSPAAVERDARRRKAANERRAAEGRLIEELRGVLPRTIESVWDLVNTSDPYDAALPILMAHLRRPYDPKILEGIARALAVPEANQYWSELVSMYRECEHAGVRGALAVAVAASASSAEFLELASLVKQKALGSSRVLLLSAVLRTGQEAGHRLLEGLREDPQLGAEIRAILR